LPFAETADDYLALLPYHLDQAALSNAI